MTSSAVKNMLPPGLVSNLQDVLSKRGGDGSKSNNHNNADSSQPDSPASKSNGDEPTSENDDSKPVILVTNGDGIESPGLTFLVEALVREGLYNVHVCAPQSDKSASAHAITHGETVAVNSAEINGATAYEVSGTPVDCVSLVLSGALFSWSKPALVISGINKGSSCGLHMFYSGVVAGAREALISGVPSMSISLNWKDESQESDFKDAVTVCLPLVNAVIRDIEKGIFPKSCLLNIQLPTSPSTKKGYKLTKQSKWRFSPSWLAISSNRHSSAGRFTANQQGLGIQLAQLGRDASAAGAARRLGTQKKDIEIVESVGVSGKSNSGRTMKYFRLEFLERRYEDEDEDLDFRALDNGFVAITPLFVSPRTEPDIEITASDWISAALLQLKQ